MWDAERTETTPRGERRRERGNSSPRAKEMKSKSGGKGRPLHRTRKEPEKGKNRDVQPGQTNGKRQNGTGKSQGRNPQSTVPPKPRPPAGMEQRKHKQGGNANETTNQRRCQDPERRGSRGEDPTKRTRQTAKTTGRPAVSEGQHEAEKSKGGKDHNGKQPGGGGEAIRHGKAGERQGRPTQRGTKNRSAQKRRKTRKTAEKRYRGREGRDQRKARRGSGRGGRATPAGAATAGKQEGRDKTNEGTKE